MTTLTHDPTRAMDSDELVPGWSYQLTDFYSDEERIDFWTYWESRMLDPEGALDMVLHMTVTDGGVSLVDGIPLQVGGRTYDLEYVGHTVHYHDQGNSGKLLIFKEAAPVFFSGVGAHLHRPDSELRAVPIEAIESGRTHIWRDGYPGGPTGCLP